MTFVERLLDKSRADPKYYKQLYFVLTQFLLSSDDLEKLVFFHFKTVSFVKEIAFTVASE